MSALEREWQYSYFDSRGVQRDFDPHSHHMTVTIDPSKAMDLEDFVRARDPRLTVEGINRSTGFARIVTKPNMSADDAITSLTEPQSPIITAATPAVIEYDTNDIPVTRYFLAYRLLVSIKKERASDADKLLKKLGFTVVKQYGLGYYSVSFQRDPNVPVLDALFQQLNSWRSKLDLESELPFVGVEPHEVGFDAALLDPNDSKYASQWNLKCTVNRVRDVKAPEAWGLTTGVANRVIVAVLDTGIATGHGDFTTKIVDQYNAITDQNTLASVADTNGHGTKVAGVIGARTNWPAGPPGSGTGVAGMAWNCSLFPVKIDVDLVTLDYAVVKRGIDEVTERAVANLNNRYVMNLSWKADGDNADVHTAIQGAYDAGVVIVAAAADDNKDVTALPVNYPAAYSEVIAVGGHLNDDPCTKHGISNWGINLVIAPGKDVWTTVMPNTYGKADGTSVAAGHVSGTAALCFSRHYQLHGNAFADAPAILRQKVYDAILLHLRSWSNPGSSFKGRLDAFAAVNAMT